LNDVRERTLQAWREGARRKRVLLADRERRG